jgi:hypothetical protein
MNQTFCTTLLALLMIAWISLESHGRTAPVADSLDGPSDVAAAYIEAFQQRKWTRCADLMHPEALQSLKDVLVKAVASDSLSGLPDALYGNGTPPETIRFAPPEELYARMLEVVYQRAPEASDVLDGFSAQVLGEVQETDRLVHVVARTNVRGVSEVTQVEVFTVQKFRDTWRMNLTTDIQDIGRRID